MDHRVLPSHFHPGIVHLSPSVYRQFFTFFRSPVHGEMREEPESGGQDNRQQANRYGFLAPDRTFVETTPCSRKQDTFPVQEDPQTRFYADYRKMADEYDKEFLKKYDEDLNTTLIFVSLIQRFCEYALTTVSGWSVLCRGFGLHHPGRLSIETRFR